MMGNIIIPMPRAPAHYPWAPAHGRKKAPRRPPPWLAAWLVPQKHAHAQHLLLEPLPMEG